MPRSQSSSLVLGATLTLTAVVGLAACSGCQDPKPEPPPPDDDACSAYSEGSGPELTDEARRKVAGYVSGGESVVPKSDLTQVLGRQGLKCNALAYRACAVARSANASPNKMGELVAVALEACKRGGSAIAPPPTAAPSPPSGGWAAGLAMQRAIEQVAKVARKIEEGSSYGFAPGNAFVYGAYQRSGAALTLRLRFRPKVGYRIVGGGSGGANNVDLIIKNDSGAVVARDDSQDATPYVAFVPPNDAWHVIELSLASTKENYAGAFTAMALLCDGGLAVPISKLEESFERARFRGARASDDVRAKGLGTGLGFPARGDWSFISTVREEGQSSGLMNLRFRGTPEVVLAAADRGVQDLGLTVTDNDDVKRIIAEDNSHGPAPMVDFLGTAGELYRVSVSNKRATGKAVVTWLILEVEK